MCFRENITGSHRVVGYGGKNDGNTSICVKSDIYLSIYNIVVLGVAFVLFYSVSDCDGILYVIYVDYSVYAAGRNIRKTLV